MGGAETMGGVGSDRQTKIIGVIGDIGAIGECGTVMGWIFSEKNMWTMVRTSIKMFLSIAIK